MNNDHSLFIVIELTTTRRRHRINGERSCGIHPVSDTFHCSISNHGLKSQSQTMTTTTRWTSGMGTPDPLWMGRLSVSQVSKVHIHLSLSQSCLTTNFIEPRFSVNDRVEPFVALYDHHLHHPPPIATAHHYHHNGHECPPPMDGNERPPSSPLKWQRAMNAWWPHGPNPG